MTLFAAGPRLSRRRFVYPLTAIAALGLALALTLSLAVSTAAATAAGPAPSGARVLTVTPVFGQDPNVSRHHLDHAFTITDPAKVARIAAIINGLAPFPIGILSCARGNGAEMKLTFRARPHGKVLATVVATYTGCARVWNLNARDGRPVEDYTRSGRQLQAVVLSIAGVRWPYTPTALPPLQP